MKQMLLPILMLLLSCTQQATAPEVNKPMIGTKYIFKRKHGGRVIPISYTKIS